MYVQAHAGRIFVDDAGSSDCPAVFVHSLAGTSRHWREQLDHIRQTGCAVAYDLRGHGRSDPPASGEYSLEANADDLLAVVDALGIDEFLLVGHSLGAGVATVFAAAHPRRVRGLLVVDPVGDQRLAPDEMQTFLVALDTPHYAEIIRDYWASISGPDPSLRDRLIEDLAKTPRAAVIGMLRALQRTNLTRAIRQFPGPKLAVVTPLNDFPFSLHRVDADVRPIVIEGTGHWLQLEKPAEFNQILDAFMLESGARQP
jgi:pimeloyl-ACP methyl ester carboxylesterase